MGKLFWTLKFLIPKLRIIDPNQDTLDELLEAVDLSSYGLERVKLNHEIELDASGSELGPQNPNPRGYRDGEQENDRLDEIVRIFNERWSQGWCATPDEQRFKFVIGNTAQSVRTHPDFQDKYANNQDPQNRTLAFKRILNEVMLEQRENGLEVYRLFVGEEAFNAAWQWGIERLVNEGTQAPKITQGHW